MTTSEHSGLDALTADSTSDAMTTVDDIITAAETEEAASEGMRVAMRVVLPDDGDLDAIPLYIDGGKKGAPHEQRPDDVLDRRRLRVRAGKRVSLGSYFNAFPAGYWRAWTVVEFVRLRVVTDGAGSVMVYKSNARGASQQVTHREMSGHSTVTFDLPLKTFGDGGFYWFDLIGADGGLVLTEADWSVPDSGRPRGRVTLGVTTFNRPDYCVRTIGMVAADPDLCAILDEMIIVDQGTQKVANDGGFATVAEQLGPQLRIVDQINLGGSGGFSRCMYEGVTKGQSDYVLLLDDDIILETESIQRLVTFADMCRKPTIIGGHMFDMNNRSVLHTFGEIVNPFYWQPGLPDLSHTLEHDFGAVGLRHTKWMHQRVDVDYNGWWMCLIPLGVIRQLGLSLPIFIKWDDAEYGLRAKERDIHTVSLPGACVWHVSWGDKDDLVGWQAYFHARNRLITALMYSPFSRGASMLRTAFFLDLKHLVSMQYYTGTGRIMALRDALAGPDGLHELLPERLGQIRSMAGDFSDAVVKMEADAFPPVKRRKPIKPAKALAAGTLSPSLGVLITKGATSIMRQMVLPMDARAREFPQERVAHKDNKWYHVARNDSAVVSTADGTGASWYKRDPERARSMALEVSQLYAAVVREWPTLRDRYRGARDEITSLAAWERTFGLGREQG